MRNEHGAGIGVLKATVLVSLAALVSILANGCAASKAKPSDLDYSTTRTSQNGIFRVAIAPAADPIPLNRIHTWQVPTKPVVRQNLGNGSYLVEGMKFQMHGWWVVTFVISAGGKSDTVTFNLRL